MFKKQIKIKASTICWHQFTRRSDAVFLSLGREIRIGVLSVATLLAATPNSASAQVAMAPVHTEEATEHIGDDTADEDLWVTTDLNEMLVGNRNEVQDDKRNEGTVFEDPNDSSIIEKHIQLSCTEVTASRIPISSDKATRMIQIITKEDLTASAAQSVSDLLKLVAGVDVRQRGGFGIQTDVGVNGSHVDQVTVMLNGVNISNPHTGHLTMDLPVSMNDIERIEVLEGGASRVYGSSAFAGVINIVTKTAVTNNTEIALSGGSYGTFGTDGQLDLLSGHFMNHFSGAWMQSNGAAANSDFKKGTLYWNKQYASDWLDIRFQAGLSDTRYGANTFYGTGSNSQYEENRRYLIALQGDIKGRLHLLPQLYWNRTYDHYVWKRANPSAYENYHQTNVYGANINAWTQWSFGKTAVGFEFRREEILSTRLGNPIDPSQLNRYPGYKYKDGRSNFSLYLEHDVVLDSWSFSAGLLANKNTSVVGGMKLYPGIDISYSPLQGMRLYASFNQSLRTPTYTDLYYNGPGLEANRALKPEKSTDYAVGCRFAASTISASIKGFYRHETDMIDWVKLQGADTWTNANSDINNLGAEALLTFDFCQHHPNSWLQYLSLSYCYNHQQRINEQQTANYASQLVYLRHKFVATLRHRIINRLSAQWEFVYKDRTGWFDNALTGNCQHYGSFGQLNLKLQWEEKQWKLYMQGNNLTDKQYYDIANVPQPGCWFMVGAKYAIGF